MDRIVDGGRTSGKTSKGCFRWLRLRAAGEETLASLQIQVDDDEGSGNPRLILNARPQRTMVELEFVATTRQENVEDQLAYLSDEASVQTFDDLSLRLLRHYSAAVRHQKFHGVDIVTIQSRVAPDSTCAVPGRSRHCPREPSVPC